jgi:predicted DNA-binding protein
MYHMAFSLRLDPRTETTIRRLAAATGRSKAAVVRGAMERYAAGEFAEVALASTLYERLKPFAGTIATGQQLSSDTHAKFKRVLERKRDAGRSR